MKLLFAFLVDTAEKAFSILFWYMIFAPLFTQLRK